MMVITWALWVRGWACAIGSLLLEVKARKLEHGYGMLDAGFPSFFGLGIQDDLFPGFCCVSPLGRK